jgi:phage-related baseplate assembly protein
MASDDRVRAAVGVYVDKMEALHDAKYPDAYIFPCMSAALDAADAVALTPAQREAEGMVTVLRNISKTLNLAECDSDVVIHAMNADANICEILARIDGGK